MNQEHIEQMTEQTAEQNTRQNAEQKKRRKKKKPGRRPGASPALRRKKRRKKQRQMYFHIAVAALALFLLILGSVKLSKWSRGKDSGYDPNATDTGFDVETEDYAVPLDSKTASLQADDNLTTVLLLGNNVLAKKKGQPDGIAACLEAAIGGKVYDASLDHTYLSVRNVAFDEDDPEDAFSLYWISQCISLGDFTFLEDNARAWEGDDTAAETVDMLKSLDMKTVDAVVIMYDYHDFTEKRLLASPYDDSLAGSCCGCLTQSLRLLRGALPQARIVVSSPYYFYVETDEGLLPCEEVDYGQGTIADYMIAYKNIAVNENVSFIDNYYGTITPEDHKDYLEDDMEHLNEKGRKAVAQRMAAFIS